MYINETNLSFTGAMSNRTRTDYIVLHHRAGNGDVESIHNQHLRQGYSGIGYHYYIRKDGSIYAGRPIQKVGAHCLNYNSVSVGVCFEGNYETETVMPEAQKKSGIELVRHLKGIYPNAQIKGHRDLYATACPGRNFPFEEIKREAESVPELTTVNDIVWELANRGIITDKDLWLKKLEEDTDAYWLARKCANYAVIDTNAVGITDTESEE